MSPKQHAVICVRKGHLTLKSNLSVIHPSRLFSNSLPPASSKEGRHQQLIHVCLQMALGLWRSKYWNAHSNLSFQKLWQIYKPHSDHCYLGNCQSRELYIQTSKGWCHWCLHPLIWSYAPALRENSERYTLWCHAIFALSKALCKGFRDWYFSVVIHHTVPLVPHFKTVSPESWNDKKNTESCNRWCGPKRANITEPVWFSPRTS